MVSLQDSKRDSAVQVALCHLVNCAIVRNWRLKVRSRLLKSLRLRVNERGPQPTPTELSNTFLHTELYDGLTRHWEQVASQSTTSPTTSSYTYSTSIDYFQYPQKMCTPFGSGMFWRTCAENGGKSYLRPRIVWLYDFAAHP